MNHTDAESSAREDACPECTSEKLIHDRARGEVHCAMCGIVVQENVIDSGPEWRAFDSTQRDSRERTGAPLSLMHHDLGMGTVLWGRTDASGKSLHGAELGRVRRLQKWDRRTKFKRGAERNLAQALTEIKRMGTGLDVPRGVQEEAARIYREAANKNLIRGRSIDSVAAASLYAAMRTKGVPRSLEETAKVSRVGKREIGRVYKVVASELQLSLSPVNPSSFIPRFGSRLRLPAQTEARALEIVRKAVEEEVVSGKDPKSVAAGALYIASVLTGQPRTQKDVSEASGVTEVTIRNRYKELIEALKITFDFTG